MNLVKSPPTLVLGICWFLAGSVSQLFANAAEPVASGGETQYRTRMLTSQINWYKDLAQAKMDAQKNRKLIFWVHMLGDIGGYT